MIYNKKASFSGNVPGSHSRLLNVTRGGFEKFKSLTLGYCMTCSGKGMPSPPDSTTNIHGQS
jgi:hypothetical protein